MTKQPAPVGGAGPVRVLLVDASLTFLDTLSRSLERRGNVQVVGRVLSGLEAVDQALLLQPDLVLMDVGTGPVTGMDATREMKRGPRAPVVALLSIGETAAQRAAARAAGADAYVPKNRLEDELPALLRAARPDRPPDTPPGR